MNSLIRGHSGIRWEVLEAMEDILEHDIVPVVPLRGSISASGGKTNAHCAVAFLKFITDLSPLSYIASTITGNPRIKTLNDRKYLPADAALAVNGLKPVVLQSKEHLGLLNGTAFSAAVAGLALFDAIQLALLAQICTAMSTEAINGSKGSFDPFIHDVARPHPGQVPIIF
jgi:phenylalanine ammonia-lyase